MGWFNRIDKSEMSEDDKSELKKYAEDSEKYISDAKATIRENDLNERNRQEDKSRRNK